MAPDLISAFNRCLRYQGSPRFLKPVIDPARFLRNQLRQKFRKTEGSIELAGAFHMDRFSIVAGEAISEGIACHGIIEPNLTGAFLRLVKPGQTVLDVGMHLGYFSTLMARLVGGDGIVHSFEPTPSTREIAARNTARFSNITIHPHAMWSHRETMTFHDYGAAHMAFNSVTSARTEEGLPTVREFEVESISLDEFRDELGVRIDVIKIDAETAELAIIQGARRTFASDRPVVTLEVGDEAGQPGRSRHLIETMREMDYLPWEFERGAFKAHRPKDTYSYDNLIFAPTTGPLA